MSGSSAARIAVLVCCAYFGALLGLGCGSKYPTHDGYHAKRTKPWKRPKKLRFDEDGEAEADDRVDYAKRKRARWFAVTLPGDGSLMVRLNVTADQVYEDFDIGFEVYNSKFKRLHRSDNESEDAGELKKSTLLTSLPQGTYLVHVFLQSRTDKADFELRLKYSSGEAQYSSNFPANVPFPGTLPAVPLFESFSCDRCSCNDSKCRSACNKCSYCRRCSCRYRKCRARCRGKCRRGPIHRPRFSCRTCSCKSSARCRKSCTKKCKKKPDGPPKGVVYGRIIRSRARGGGTFILINRGSNVGLKVGSSGAVINKKGRAISGGSFSLSSVSTRSSTATVKATLDQVSGAGRVRLKP